MNDTCAWVVDDTFEDGGDERDYSTECGHETSFNDGGPVENYYHFCPYCGKPLEVVK